MQAEGLRLTCNDADGYFSNQAWTIVVSLVDLDVDQVGWSFILSVEHAYSQEPSCRSVSLLKFGGQKGSDASWPKINESSFSAGTRTGCGDNLACYPCRYYHAERESGPKCLQFDTRRTHTHTDCASTYCGISEPTTLSGNITKCQQSHLHDLRVLQALHDCLHLLPYPSFNLDPEVLRSMQQVES